MTVTAALTNGQGAGAVTGAALTLSDDETLPTVALALSASSISETGGISTVTATLSGPSSEAVTVTVAAAAGTGAVAADFDLSSATTLTIAAGRTTSAGLVTVTANGNAVDSPNKSVTVSGTAAGGNNVANPPNVTLTLEDDEDVADGGAGVLSTFVGHGDGRGLDGDRDALRPIERSGDGDGGRGGGGRARSRRGLRPVEHGDDA